MTTSWDHGVGAAAAVEAETEGGEPEDREDPEVEDRLASERDPPAEEEQEEEERRTSGNRLMRSEHRGLGCS